MTTTWLFRKKRALGNFSIEQSFEAVAKAWPTEGPPEWIEATHFSEGWSNRWKIIRQAQSIKTDILHITGDIHFAALAWPKWRRNRPRVVLTIHDIGFLVEHTGLKRRLMKKIWLTWPLRCIDHLITVSEATKKAVLLESPWFPSEKITVIPTAVSQHFQPRSFEPKNLKPVALHIGTALNKNLHNHAKALQGLDIKLRIIGELSDADHCMLQDLNIDYTSETKLTAAEMQMAFATSDVLLFASTLEGFGMPILEAQMIGLPVITSNIEPLIGVAGDGALLCDPQDSDAIKKAVVRVTSNAALRKEIMKRGSMNCKQFSPEKSASLIHTFYLHLLS